MFTKIFWGSVVILFGLSIILNAVFKIHFPFFKVLIAIIIIAFGFKLLFGSFGYKSNSGNKEHSAVFSSEKIKADRMGPEMEYNSVFGSQTIDLRQTSFETREAHVEINAVFGSVKVILPERVHVRVKATSAFGSVRTPDGDQISFGEARRSFTLGTDAELTIHLEANAVFGGVDIR